MNKNNKIGPYNRHYAVTLNMKGNSKNKREFRKSRLEVLGYLCQEVSAGRMNASQLIGLKRIKQIKRVTA